MRIRLNKSGSVRVGFHIGPFWISMPFGGSQHSKRAIALPEEIAASQVRLDSLRTPLQEGAWRDLQRAKEELADGWPVLALKSLHSATLVLKDEPEVWQLYKQAAQNEFDKRRGQAELDRIAAMRKR